VDYCGSDALPGVFCDPLPDPPAGAAAIDFDADGLGALRELVAGEAQRAGFAGRQGEDFLVAANEIATNSVRHGGGGGRLVVWSQDETLLCEVRDAGAIADPLVGRRRPAPGQSGGYGVWIANQVCDLVQVRTSESGSVVRLHMRRR
jgi:anti-sigma regulatory factor (Ser/Thr protein kinase)